MINREGYNTYAANINSAAMSKTFIANVFSWMLIALGITATISYYVATTPELLRHMINVETGGMSILGYIIVFAPLGLVFLMNLGYQKLSAKALSVIFIIYSILMGASLSFIFLIYTGSSIAITFGVTAATFGVMAILGYTTRTDLTKFGSILIMALVGIIIASLVNLFLHSEAINYIISIIGVLVFTGLTAYDVQKLKRIGAGVEFGAENTRKLTILGALTLYLDFINLFLFLLRFLGDRK
ncbi:MAG: Bax inhibitor-1/YccA family protein [Hyphomicrobiales bacterium]